MYGVAVARAIPKIVRDMAPSHTTQEDNRASAHSCIHLPLLRPGGIHELTMMLGVRRRTCCRYFADSCVVFAECATPHMSEMPELAASMKAAPCKPNRKRSNHKPCLHGSSSKTGSMRIGKGRIRWMFFRRAHEVHQSLPEKQNGTTNLCCLPIPPCVKDLALVE